jgi:hypothetical protein
MPRSLNQAGIGTAPVWVKAEHCHGQPFYVLGATTRNNRFGNEEVVFKLRLRDGVYDADGDLHKVVHLSLTNNGGQRSDMVSYFKTSNDPLGPLVFHEIETDKGNPFYQMVDAQDFDLQASRETLPVLPPRRDRDEPDPESLQDLPF